MSETLISQHRRRRYPASASALTASRRLTLLEAAASGDVQAIGLICDRHGAALFGLARAIVGDPEQAEAVVVDVVARACADPGATAIAATGSLRRELARLTYLYSVRSLTLPDAWLAPYSALKRMAGLAELARHQRAAVALVQCGDHSVDDVSDLLGLSVPVVAVLLCAGLRDLEVGDRRAADDGLQGHRETGAAL